MMEFLGHFIEQYGYYALLVGTFLEGETILILAGWAAQRELLDLWTVIGVATIGTLLGDQLFFYIGRWKGMAWIERRPVWKARADKLNRMLEKHRVVVVLGYRFLYGLRTVTPFALGASGFRPLVFTILNVIAAGVWAISFGYLGFFFGSAIESVIGKVKKYELWGLVALALVFVVIWIITAVRSRRAAARAKLAAETASNAAVNIEIPPPSADAAPPAASVTSRSGTPPRAARSTP
ncbi:MAG TPA: DedA family protein [Phycisphaerales bacterium]|nr:DedA family protein [Phycisphaerales bacterium]